MTLTVNPFRFLFVLYVNVNDDDYDDEENMFLALSKKLLTLLKI